MTVGAFLPCAIASGVAAGVYAANGYAGFLGASVFTGLCAIACVIMDVR